MALELCQVRYSKTTDEILSFPLDKDGYFSVGRHTGNNFVIYLSNSPIFTSKFHGVLDIRDGIVKYRDISSTNGTYLNNERMEPHVSVELKEGDELSFGGKTIFKPTNIYNPFIFIVQKKEEVHVSPPIDCIHLNERQKRVLNEEWKCGICMDPLLKPFSLPCGHTSCADCITDWFESSLVKNKPRSCPTCRFVLKPHQEPHPSIQLQNLIDKIVEPVLDEDEYIERVKRRKIWSNREKLQQKLEEKKQDV